VVAAMNRRALLNMLSIMKQLPVQLNDKTISKFEKINLADVLANLFISELYKAVISGLSRMSILVSIFMVLFGGVLQYIEWSILTGLVPLFTLGIFFGQLQ
jgi:hypothetical protein